MKYGKVIFWLGVLLCTVSLYGHGVGIYLLDDRYFLLAFAIILISRQWEMCTLFFIMAAFFEYQTSIEYDTLWAIILGVTAILCAIITRIGYAANRQTFL